MTSNQHPSCFTRTAAKAAPFGDIQFARRTANGRGYTSSSMPVRVRVLDVDNILLGFIPDSTLHQDFRCWGDRLVQAIRTRQSVQA